MRPMKYPLTSLAILLLVFTVYSQDKRTLDPTLKSKIEDRIAKGIHQSLAIALIDKDGVSYYNFGATKAGGANVDEQTIYEIGSVTKVFTGILLAKQSLDGDLSLDDNINDYLPDEGQVVSYNNVPITFGHLSDHTSGIPRLPGNMAPKDPANPYADYTVEMMYEFISSYSPARAVGSQYEYSNLAQGLLGHILTLNKSTTYEELVVSEITSQLKMNDTRITFNDNMLQRLASPHSEGVEVKNWDIPTLAGAGAIRSSAYDMAKFVSANLGFQESPLKPAMELSHTERHDKAGMGVGLGWHIQKNGSAVHWHNGGTGGYRSFIGFDKEKGLGVVVLSNSTKSVDDIGFGIFNPDQALTTYKTKDNAVDVADDILESYVGVYQLTPVFSITITKEDAQLYGQATGQSRFELYAENDTDFFLTVVEAKITFQLEDEKVKSLTLYQNGQVIPGKKVE